MKILQIRNATLKLFYGGKIILTDPMLSPRHGIESFAGKEKNPTIDLPMPLEEILDDIDMVLVSHIHQDHFDQTARDRLPKDIPLFCQPVDRLSIEKSHFTDVRPVEDTVTWEGITVTRTPGKHGTGNWEKVLGSVSGFLLKAAGEPVIFWAGDTILTSDVKSIIETVCPDIIITHSCGACLEDSGPIIMDAQQTIDTCKAAPEAIVIAVHMEALDHATVTRHDIRQLAVKNHIGSDRLFIPENGELLEFGGRTNLH